MVVHKRCVKENRLNTVSFIYITVDSDYLKF